MSKAIIRNFIILILLFITSILVFIFLRLETDTAKLVLTYIRIPALLKIIAAGSSLSLAGMFLQNISKNPLADPYLTGLSSGAGLFIVLSIIFFEGMYYSLFGFIGAVLCAALVLGICSLSKFTITKLILTGLSLNLFAGSLISFLILMNPQKAYVMTLVLTGGITNSEINNSVLILIFLLLMALCALFTPKLNVFRLDNRLVFKSEKETNIYSIIFIVLSALLTSISVYCAGILGFIGIICPLLSKMFMGQDSRILFFSNILTGSSLLIISNILAANLIYPLIIPLGVVVSLIGAPIFVYFLIKKGGIFNA